MDDSRLIVQADVGCDSPNILLSQSSGVPTLVHERIVPPHKVKETRVDVLTKGALD